MHILLCCAAGMSTSLLVTKMEKVAQEKGIKVKISAVSGAEVRSYIDEVDVLLLGPQVRYLLPKMKKMCNERGIPVDVIHSVHYGLCNGEAVLEAALSMKA
ncbi:MULTISPECIES: PTS sugar transporter subunit IIB [unclassified Bacillus cereus group]|uniref:PTS sugar transporter subunit IIB n=1 Tax=unclassified Bacillus cereus group TaxID=2750818 RepID=UPI001F58AE61|nr:MULTISPECIES: PTS sugar transporter subunit IIB [unclassified Bacillus cereus group]